MTTTIDLPKRNRANMLQMMWQAIAYVSAPDIPPAIRDLWRHEAMRLDSEIRNEFLNHTGSEPDPAVPALDLALMLVTQDFNSYKSKTLKLETGNPPDNFQEYVNDASHEWIKEK